MRLGQIIRRALIQCGEDIADLEEYRELLTGYANEGYHRIIREAYRPQRSATIYAEEGGIASIAMLKRAVEIKSVTRGGKSMPYAYRPTEKALEVIGAKEDDEITVIYTHDEADLTEGDEEPRIPLEAHGALADYATYRYLMNGNLVKQQRAQAFLASFLEAMRKIRPFGALDGGLKNWKNLYSATRG